MSIIAPSGGNGHRQHLDNIRERTRVARSRKNNARSGSRLRSRPVTPRRRTSRTRRTTRRSLSSRSVSGWSPKR